MNTRECCAACLHTDRSLPHLSLGSSQLKFVPPLRRRRRIPCPPPPGGMLCTKGERDKNKREFVYCCGHTCTRARAVISFFFPFFFRGRLQETLSDCITLWDTDDVSGVVCARRGKEPLPEHTRSLYFIFASRKRALLYIVSSVHCL